MPIQSPESIANLNEGISFPFPSATINSIFNKVGTEFHNVTLWRSAISNHTSASLLLLSLIKINVPPALKIPKMSYTDKSKS